MSAKSVAGFFIGSIAGAVCGFAAGVLMAPRSGAESRAMAADAMNDAWDSAVDSYERGARMVNEKLSASHPDMGATTDELRAKVDLARERMDQLRDSLSDAVTATSAQVQDAVNDVSDKVTTATNSAFEPEADAEGVHVEVVGNDATSAVSE
jgi:gas vesicle protein